MPKLYGDIIKGKEFISFEFTDKDFIKSLSVNSKDMNSFPLMISPYNFGIRLFKQKKYFDSTNMYKSLMTDIRLLNQISLKY